MATVQFGNFSIDMRDDEFYGRPELVLADQFVSGFVVSSEQVLVSTSTLVRVVSFDTAGRSIVSELAGNLGFGVASRLTVEVQGIVDETTGTFFVSPSGSLSGTVMSSVLRTLATNELIAAYTGLNLPFASNATDIQSFDDSLLLNGNDTITSGSGSDYLLGYGGDDVISGGGGDDTLQGDEGNDTLQGDGGNDTLRGGAGEDALRGGDGHDSLDGGIGVDELAGGHGDDTYILSATDILPAFLSIRGDPGELITGGQSVRVVPESGGFPSIQAFDSTSDPDQSIDTVRLSIADQRTGTSWNIVFSTWAMHQPMEVGSYANAVGDSFLMQALFGSPVMGVSGNNRTYDLNVATGRFDVLEASFSGPGPVATVLKLWIDFEWFPLGPANPGLRGELVLGASGFPADTIVESENAGTDTVQSAIGLELPANVENLVLTGSSNADGTGNDLDNELIGNEFANVLQGLAGRDSLYGMGGNDTLIGGEDDDHIDGGPGVDTVSYSAIDTGVVVRLDLGWTVDASGRTDTLVDIENVVGTAFSDVLIGMAGLANDMSAGDGDDVIYIDSLDTVSGGLGTDRAVAFGSNGVTLTMSDIEWFWGSNAADFVNASAQTQTVTIFGMAGDDSITGGTGADQLYGQDGADVLVGGDGDDWLYVDSQDISGGSIQGGPGTDRVASLDGSAVSIDLAVSSIEWVWASNFGDNLDGTTQASGLYLFAFGGGDVLRGGGGNDSLYGMAGADAMYGGGGNDVLYFDSDDTMVDGSTGYDTAQVLDYTGVGVTLDLGARQIEAVYASNQADTLDASVATWAVFMNGYNGDDVMSGGSGDDNIYGGGGADTITGGGGNDFLDGSGGPEIDTLVVSGVQADYVLHYTGGVLTSVQDLVGGRDGWDNVAGFERIQFTDVMFTT